MARRAAPVALVTTGLALAVASVALGRGHPGWWFAGESDTASVLELLAGLALIGAGAAAWRRRPVSRFGPLLFLAGLAWFVPEWNNPAIGSAPLFTAGLVLGAACPPLVTHAALGYPGGWLHSRAERAAVGLAYVACVGLLGVLPALLFDPAAEGCAQCPRNLLLVTADGELAETIRRIGLGLGPLWVALVAVLAARRLARASVAERRLIMPVLVPAGAYLLAVAWVFQRGVDRGFVTNGSFELALWSAQAFALTLLGVGATWEWVRARRTRSALAALVVELERSPAPGALGPALARRLGDPSLELLHPLSDGGLVDSGGLQRAPGGDQQLTPLVSRGRTLAIIAHRPGLFVDPGLAEEVASVARLALENERLQAVVRAQLQDLRASRARIVEAGDTERRRLERNLHDGAQQRLVALSLAVGLAIAEHRGNQPRLEGARQELRLLLAELRELAHGIYPVALAEEGFAAAVEALAEQSRVAVRLRRPVPEGRLDAPVETAAYMIIREMTGDARRGWISVDTRREGDRLVLEVTGDGGPPAELVYLEDRVGAVGGSLRLEPPAEGVTCLRAELPCV
jgi:signal transduction histidine kinase